jgi:hypothetical protein
LQNGLKSESVPVSTVASQQELSPPTPFADSDPSSCCFSKSNPLGGQIPLTTVASPGEADGGKERQEAATTERHHVFLNAPINKKLSSVEYLQSQLPTGQ